MRGWLIAGVVGGFVCGSAFAQTTGPFVTTENGLFQPSTLNAAQSANLPTESLGFGNSSATAFGYDFGNGFSTEIESLSSNAASDRLGGLAASGNLTAARVTLKGMYDFSDGAWHLKPYVGAGFGVMDVNEHILGMNGNGWATAYQLRGGVTLGFTQKLVGSLEYRWTNGSKPVFALAGIPTKVEVDRHGFTVGFNYKY